MAALALAPLLAAQAPAPDTGFRGSRWDLALDGSFRRCQLMLGLEPASTGMAVRFPAGCRRALPILNSVAGWSAPERETLRFMDSKGEPVLEFEPEGDEALVAMTPSGETYRLTVYEDPSAVTTASIGPRLEPAFASLPGSYVVALEGSGAGDCRVTLTSTMIDPRGRYQLELAPDCGNRELIEFAPATWRYEAGALTIASRSGREVTFLCERDGQWHRHFGSRPLVSLLRAGP